MFHCREPYSASSYCWAAAWSGMPSAIAARASAVDGRAWTNLLMMEEPVPEGAKHGPRSDPGRGA